METGFIVFGKIIPIFVAIWMLVNAVVMIVSPPTWFRLPSWLRIQQVLLVGEKYSGNRDSIQLRSIGVLIAVGGIYMIYIGLPS